MARSSAAIWSASAFSSTVVCCICLRSSDDLPVERLAPRAEQRRLALQGLDDLGLARARRKVGRETSPRASIARSASSRAALARSPSSCGRSRSNVASSFTSSITTRIWPIFTRSPSRTRISLTMPPSWCCTILRFMSTLTKPGAMTAPVSGAATSQPPRRARRAPSRRSRRARCRVRSARSASGSRSCHPAHRPDAARHTRQDFGARPVQLDHAVAQHQQLVDAGKQRGPVRDDHRGDARLASGRAAPAAAPRRRRASRLALGSSSTTSARLAVERARQRDALALARATAPRPPAPTSVS